jgi:hypothetical protein
MTSQHFAGGEEEEEEETAPQAIAKSLQLPYTLLGAAPGDLKRVAGGEAEGLTDHRDAPARDANRLLVLKFGRGNGPASNVRHVSDQ